MILRTSSTRAYFNTAAALAIAAVLGWSGATQAESLNSEIFCQNTSAVDPNDAILPPYNIKFIPHSSEYDTMRDQLKKHVLPILSADQTRIWSLGSRILSNLPVDWDLSKSPNQYFLIVHSKTVKMSNYRPALGMFIQTIGVARVDSTTEHPIAALKIIAANQEITQADHLIAARCVPDAVAGIDSTSHDGHAIEVAKIVTPKVVAFLDENTFGSRDSVVLIDKGLNDGVSVGQTWDLIDQLPDQPASAQSFGHAKVLQSFTDVSMLQIGNVSHEVRLQTPLRRNQP